MSYKPAAQLDNRHIGSRRNSISLLLFFAVIILLAVVFFDRGYSSDYEVGVQFQDSVNGDIKGPTMVVVPAGSFIMGSTPSEPGRYNNEANAHNVSFSDSFAIGLTEITVAEFKTFVRSTGYLTTAEKLKGSFIRSADSGEWELHKSLNWRYDYAGKPAGKDMPVVHISWDDAQKYSQWLSKETNKTYRLPSEAELEYTNRAGTTSTYWWGDGAPKNKVANVKGEFDKAQTPELLWKHTPIEENYAFKEGPTELFFHEYQDGFGGVAPVASFEPNPFGLYDTTGNVWEWAQDCWHHDYYGAPTNGDAWIEDGECNKRVLRGGSYYCYPRHVRSANRWSAYPEYRSMYTGFRVMREL